MVTDDREGILQATEVMRTRAAASGGGHRDDEIVAVGVDMGAAPAQALLHTLDTAGFHTTVLVVAAVRWEGNEADSAASHMALATTQWGSRVAACLDELAILGQEFLCRGGRSRFRLLAASGGAGHGSALSTRARPSCT